MPWLHAIACLVVLAGVSIFIYPEAASWLSQREQSRVTEQVQTQLQQPPNNDASHRARQFEDADAYNNALASGALYAANANIAIGDGATSAGGFRYDELLDPAGNGFMGRLLYGSLDIDLPIYHGTGDKTLERGIGHLEGTSLPVGGVGTRPVLTAHRGLPTATLFDNLDKSEVGDTFTVSVLDRVLTYRVTEVQVIRPDQTEEILAEPQRDLVTLVTCTPLGINSHRILVTAERITPTPPEEALAATAAPELPGFPWWAVILGATVVVLGVYVWRSGYAMTR